MSIKSKSSSPCSMILCLSAALALMVACGTSSAAAAAVAVSAPVSCSVKVQAALNVTQGVADGLCACPGSANKTAVVSPCSPCVQPCARTHCSLHPCRRIHSMLIWLSLL